MRTSISAFVAATAIATLTLAPATASASPDVAGNNTIAQGQFQELPANVRTFLDAYTAWGANARNVDAYMNLFVSDGSARLWDSGLDKPRDTPAGIRAQIEGVNRLVPDYKFVPDKASASPDGKVAFVEAQNTGTINGKAVSFRTMHRLIFGDPAQGPGKEPTRVQDGRRSWDQTNMFRPVADEQAPLPNLFEGIASSPTDPAPGIDLPASIRELLWQHEVSPALVAGHPGNASLTGPGLAAPITGRASTTAYLDRLFGKVSDVRIQPVTTVRSGGTTYQEWIGTVTAHGGGDARPLPFSMVERTEQQAGGQQWSLHFDTMDLVASRDTVKVLRDRIFG